MQDTSSKSRLNDSILSDKAAAWDQNIILTYLLLKNKIVPRRTLRDLQHPLIEPRIR